MNLPLVSIVIANYNYGRFLDEAIASALGQTYPNVEVIVVDDGSTDDSLAVAARHPVRVVAQANAGVARARNRGAAEARGALIVFLDADDVLLPSFVERCSEVLQSAPPNVAYVYTDAEKFGLQTGRLGARAFDGRALFNGNFVPVTTLLRKRVFEDAGGFDATWPAHEDHELWARLFVRGHSGAFLDEPLFRYRFHGRTRNTLTHDQLDELHVRLVLRYPRHGLRWMLRNKRAVTRVLVRRLARSLAQPMS